MSASWLTVSFEVLGPLGKGVVTKLVRVEEFARIVRELRGEGLRVLFEEDPSLPAPVKG